MNIIYKKYTDYIVINTNFIYRTINKYNYFINYAILKNNKYFKIILLINFFIIFKYLSNKILKIVLHKNRNNLLYYYKYILY